MRRLVIGLSLSVLFLVGAAMLQANATPEVDVHTGMVTNGPVRVNQPFVWVNRVGVRCTATGGSQQWFSPDVVTIPAASGGNTGTVTVNATAVGTFNYQSPCLEANVPQGGTVHVGS